MVLLRIDAAILLTILTLQLTLNQVAGNRAKRSCDFICTTFNGQKCIPQHWVCDGDHDCEDGSDETNCPTTEAPSHEPCSANEFECDSGKCIRRSYRCDGDNDCRDYSDEINCNNVTSSFCSGFRCPNGQCISKYAVCNFYADCYDYSDEKNCTCPYYRFLCDNGRCTYQSDRCNNYDDCGDNSDERNCGLSSSVSSALIVGFVIFGVLLIVGIPVILHVLSTNRRPRQTSPSNPQQPMTVPVQVQVPVVAYTTSAGGAITTLQPAMSPPPYGYGQGVASASASPPGEGDAYGRGGDIEKVPLQ